MRAMEATRATGGGPSLAIRARLPVGIPHAGTVWPIPLPLDDTVNMKPGDWACATWDLIFMGRTSNASIVEQSESPAASATQYDREHVTDHTRVPVLGEVEERHAGSCRPNGSVTHYQSC